VKFSPAHCCCCEVLLDTFNRSDNDDMGGAWEEIAGDFDIASNKASSSTSDSMVLTVASSRSQFLTVDLDTTNIGIVFAYQDADNYGYALDGNLYEVIDGTPALLATGLTTAAIVALCYYPQTASYPAIVSYYRSSDGGSHKRVITNLENGGRAGLLTASGISGAKTADYFNYYRLWWESSDCPNCRCKSTSCKEQTCPLELDVEITGWVVADPYQVPPCPNPCGWPCTDANDVYSAVCDNYAGLGNYWTFTLNSTCESQYRGRALSCTVSYIFSGSTSILRADITTAFGGTLIARFEKDFSGVQQECWAFSNEELTLQSSNAVCCDLSSAKMYVSTP